MEGRSTIYRLLKALCIIKYLIFLSSSQFVWNSSYSLEISLVLSRLKSEGFTCLDPSFAVGQAPKEGFVERGEVGSHLRRSVHSPAGCAKGNSLRGIQTLNFLSHHRALYLWEHSRLDSISVDIFPTSPFIFLKTASETKAQGLGSVDVWRGSPGCWYPLSQSRPHPWSLLLSCLSYPSKSWFSIPVLHCHSHRPF